MQDYYKISVILSFLCAALIGRQLGEETILNGIKLPIGTHVHILLTALHRDPKYFPNPDKFDPERFTLENSQNRHPFAYIPFSASHRNCIGNFTIFFLVF